MAAVGTTAFPQGKGKLSGDSVKIGVLTDMSGLYSDLGGQGSIIAAQMAIEDFGGKIFGMPITLVSADHQNKPEVGSTRVREWFDRDGVDMVTDILNSGVGLAVAKVAGEKHKVAINVGAASTRLSNEDCNPYSIHYAYDTYALANGTGKAIVKQGGDTWFFLTADYAFGHSLENDTSNVVKANGGKVLGAVRHPLNASDFSSFLLQAQASKAKIIGLANAGGDTINSIKAANEFGITKTQSLAGLLVFISDVHSLGLNTAQGMLLTTGFYWDLDEQTRKFGRRFFDRYKKMPTMIHAGVYSATTNYLKAVQAAGTDDPDAVIAQLRKMKLDDFMMRHAQLRPDGVVQHDMYLAQVKKPSESKYPWDYYIIKATIPAAEAFQPLATVNCPMLKK
ncbi:MAG TPA: ABC transporter substrate-binding protein [Burkholderiales bacterium]|nr:ABC transporter substrate-binding protein [Burkholderiales bacterium]